MITDPPSESITHSNSINSRVVVTKTGAYEIVGLDARINVLLIEKAPSPASVTARILYCTSISAAAIS